MPGNPNDAPKKDDNGKLIRPEREEGYHILYANNQTSAESITYIGFRFKKPVLHKFNNTLLYFTLV